MSLDIIYHIYLTWISATLAAWWKIVPWIAAVITEVYRRRR